MKRGKHIIWLALFLTILAVSGCVVMESTRAHASDGSTITAKGQFTLDGCALTTGEFEVQYYSCQTVNGGNLVETARCYHIYDQSNILRCFVGSPQKQIDQCSQQSGTEQIICPNNTKSVSDIPDPDHVASNDGDIPSSDLPSEG